MRWHRFRLTNECCSRLVVEAMPIESAPITHRLSASTWQSAAISANERVRDDALIAWLSSDTGRKHEVADFEVISQDKDSQSGSGPRTTRPPLRHNITHGGEGRPIAYLFDLFFPRLHVPFLPLEMYTP